MLARVYHSEKASGFKRQTDTELLEELQREAEQLAMQHARGEISADDMLDKLSKLRAKHPSSFLSRLLGL